MALYDEQNDPRIGNDPERGAVLARDAGVSEVALDGTEGVLPGYYRLAAGRIKAAVDFAGARARSYFEHAPATKYADDSMDPALSFAPEQSIEKLVAQMNAHAYTAAVLMTKAPRVSASDRPNNATLVQNISSMQGSPRGIPSSEDELMGLLFGAF